MGVEQLILNGTMTTARMNTQTPSNIRVSRQKSLHIGISGTTARKGEEYFISRAKGPVNQWFGFHGKKQVGMRPMRGDDHVVQRRRVHRHTPLESARGAACHRG